MQIGLNLLYLIPGVVGGTETYAVELTRALAKVDRENEYHLFVNREMSNYAVVDAPNFHTIPCPVRAMRRAVRYGWEQAVLPWRLAAKKVDLVHSLGYVGPLVANCPSVVTIHDANFVRIGHTMSAVRSNALGFFCRHSARRASRVITVSEFSKRELARFCGISERMITVIHSGPGAASPPQAESESEFDPPKPFILAFCGSSHKNAVRLAEAFARIAPQIPHRLVFVGRPPRDLTAAVAAMPVRDRIFMPGYLQRHTLQSLFQSATLFVFPSTYEGFGLPLLEAQSLGCPVACSIAASLPEVGGESVSYFDPYSVDQMSAVLRRCLEDHAFRTEMRAKGAENVRRFSWGRAALETLAVYRSVLSRN